MQPSSSNAAATAAANEDERQILLTRLANLEQVHSRLATAFIAYRHETHERAAGLAAVVVHQQPHLSGLVSAIIGMPLGDSVEEATNAPNAAAQAAAAALAAAAAALGPAAAAPIAALQELTRSIAMARGAPASPEQDKSAAGESNNEEEEEMLEEAPAEEERS